MYTSLKLFFFDNFYLLITNFILIPSWTSGLKYLRTGSILNNLVVGFKIE